MRKILLVLSLSLSFLLGQVNLDVTFTPYVTYYISAIDLNTGESNVPIFFATLTNSNYPADPAGIPVSIEFEIRITSEALEMNDEVLIRIKTDTFRLKQTIQLTNQDLTIDTREIFDVTGQSVDFRIPSENIEHLEISEAEDMLSAVVQTGRLPDGIYRFTVSITDANGAALDTPVQEILNISTPTYLQLMTPGGATLADTTINEVFTSYPVFQWESDPCNIPGGCTFYIRVAEFDPAQHSTVEEAIESLTRLPLDQAEGWKSVGAGVTSFLYPVLDAGDLEPGLVYVWQILKVMGTTAGHQGILSEIFAFKVKDFTATGAPSGEGVIPTDPVMIALQSLIGDEQFNTIFGSGSQYSAFITNGNVTLDGSTVDLSLVQSLITQGVPEIDSVGTTTYHPINIISVEVEE